MRDDDLRLRQRLDGKVEHDHDEPKTRDAADDHERAGAFSQPGSFAKRKGR